MKTNFSDIIASEMGKKLDENKEMFSSAKLIEKVAFNKVSEEGNLPSEVEDEMIAKTASENCKCSECCEEGCKCHCHSKKDENDADVMDSEQKKLASVIDTLIKASEELDSISGFDKFATATIVIASKIVEAKAKKKEKSSKKETKMSKEERMKKMREMKKSKDSKKSSEKSEKSSKSKSSK